MSTRQTPLLEPVTTSEPSLVQQILLDIWRTTLDRDVTVTDDFFESGGASLLALVTIEQINQRLGWSLNMGDLLRFRTIEGLTSNKAQPQAANGERAVIRMSNQGSRTPIVFLHPGTGMVDGYARLVRLMGADRGCYGLQSPLLMTGGNRAVPDTMEGIAELYADLLEDEFGEDEFHLVGSCAGGAIALELVRLAEERGLGLRRTVVIDGYLDVRSTGEPDPQELLAQYRDDIIRLSGTSGVFQEVKPDDLDEHTAIRDVSAAIFGAAKADDRAANAFARRIYEAYRLIARALTVYRPEPVDADLLMLLAKDNFTLGDWRSVVRGELTAEVMDSDSYGMNLCLTDAETLVARIEDFLGEE
ncbi:alpha/beta fold hydrolase [Streptomyces sp. NBC_00289]|uniref:thioesterase domain-containing protein n=1 Tax=Streptomyces sp. NBC_00289 TaxID=2975703 RepID=UPI003254D71E